MPVARATPDLPWLLLMFTLPARRASERVSVWRKLQRYGAMTLPSSGYVLPNNPVNQERFEWLATSIRNLKGQASVAQVAAFDNLGADELEKLFTLARTENYERLYGDLKKLARSREGRNALPKIKRHLQQVSDIDFFGAPARAKVEGLIQQIEIGAAPTRIKAKHDPKDYIGSIWVTRPRPGIDRVSSAWLIRRFIDGQAKFIFDRNASAHPQAIPFDMFQAGGFGHIGDDCTFETLVRSFGIRDSRVRLVAQAVHDADLADERFGRDEALGIDRVLDGWNKQGLSDDELLHRGMDLIEGLYNGIQ
jgi:hypothetical protein